MKSFVAMTYYQLMHAIAMALTLEEKPVLFFSQAYLDVDEDFLDHIRATDIFRHVIGITARGETKTFVERLRQTKHFTDQEIDAVGSSIFEETLEPIYRDKFQVADPEDTIYVYNDFQPHYYYICKHFSHVVGVEDGYRSLKQQLEVHRFKGDTELLEAFIERGYYPPPLYRYERIEKIISSQAFPELDRWYQERLEIQDFRDTVALHPKEFQYALQCIFDVTPLEVPENSVLILGQPLARARYCNGLEEYLLYRRLLREEIGKGRQVFYKPHPAENTSAHLYAATGARVLEGKFPVEVLDYMGVSFEEVITVGSTGADTLCCAKTSRKLYEDPNQDEEAIVRYIKERIQDDAIEIHFILKITELTPESYLSICSFYYSHARIHSCVSVCVPVEMEEDAKRFFSRQHAKHMVKQYQATHRDYVHKTLWQREIRHIEERTPVFQNLRIYGCPNMDSWELLQQVEEREEEEYRMIVEPYNVGWRLVPLMARRLRATMRVGHYYLQEICEKNSGKIVTGQSVSPGVTEDAVSGQISNRLWHKAIVQEFLETDGRPISLAAVASQYSKEFKGYFSVTLYIPRKWYSEIGDGGEACQRAIQEAQGLAVDQATKEGLVALALYDYFDWNLIDHARSDAEQIEHLLFRSFLSAEEQSRVWRRLALSALRERNIVNGFPLLKEKEVYLYTRDSFKEMSRHGLFNLWERVRMVRNRLC